MRKGNAEPGRSRSRSCSHSGLDEATNGGAPERTARKRLAGGRPQAGGSRECHQRRADRQRTHLAQVGTKDSHHTGSLRRVNGAKCRPATVRPLGEQLSSRPNPATQNISRIGCRVKGVLNSLRNLSECPLGCENGRYEDLDYAGPLNPPLDDDESPGTKQRSRSLGKR